MARSIPIERMFHQNLLLLFFFYSILRLCFRRVIAARVVENLSFTKKMMIFYSVICISSFAIRLATLLQYK